MLFGHIYLVDFDPSVGREYQKMRPALVIQSNVVTEHSDLVTVVPVSSKIEKRDGDDVLLMKTERNRLLHDSLLKVHQVSSFDKRRFVHRIGEADQSVMEQIAHYLRKHFRL
ncbi:MAG: type II toxin-antitoxin system PemK/MazF family toxin [Ignavibacteriae bacterium]|nr:type II toxin-antitoxin system PemK/MazF family toxin [Ignavibacteriota bacterium]